MARKRLKQAAKLGANSIRAWREHRGLTLERLAARVESTAATISRVERSLQPYSQDLLEALADALQCEPADLVMRHPPSKDQLELWTVIQGMPREQQQQAIRVVKAMAQVA